jgi:hypothetical protein
LPLQLRDLFGGGLVLGLRLQPFQAGGIAGLELPLRQPA